MSMQALPFSDALKLLSYLKEWTSYSDKVARCLETSLFFKLLLQIVAVYFFSPVIISYL
jgi:hypothetical protein